jgi:hypothetical protein
MYRLVFVSSAVELFSKGQLEVLLKKSRQDKGAVGLTGMLSQGYCLRESPAVQR